MLYLTKSELMLDGYYEEPLYDESPSLGTYSTKKKIHLPCFTTIELSPSGDVLWFHGIEDISFGVSVHPGKFVITTKITKEDFCYLAPITDVQYFEINNFKDRITEIRHEIDDIRWKLDVLADAIKELLEGCSDDSVYLSQEDYNVASDRLYVLMKDSAQTERQLIHNSHLLNELTDSYRYMLDFIVGKLETDCNGPPY